jgi:hypothetical protein
MKKKKPKKKPVNPFSGVVKKLGSYKTTLRKALKG